MDTRKEAEIIQIAHFVTLTWSHNTADWKQDIRRLMKPLAREWKNHIFVEGFMGVQEKRLKKYFRRLPDCHLLVGYKRPVDEVTRMKYAAQIERRWANTNIGRAYRRSEVLDFQMTPNTIPYLFKHDDDHFLEAFCPRGRSCRKSGCVYRSDMSPWILRPGDNRSNWRD